MLKTHNLNMNKGLIVLFLASVFLFLGVPETQAVLINNYDFEFTEVLNENFCCDGIFGCGVSTSPVRRPLYWNDTEYGVHVVSTSTVPSQGDYAMKVYTHKPSNCSMWAGGCTQVNITNGGLATYSEPIELQNASFRLTVDVRKCTEEEEPVKCSGFFEAEDSFLSGTNSGMYVINTAWDNGTHTEEYSQFGTAPDYYQTINLDYSDFDYSNVSYPLNMTVGLGAAVESYWGGESSCIVFDYLEVDYSEDSDQIITFEDLSLVDDYIQDMVSMRGFIYTIEETNNNGMSFDSSGFNISNGFDGIPLARLKVIWTKGGGFCSGAWPKFLNPDIATINYKNGTSTGMIARVEQNCGGGDTFTLYFNFSIPDYENVKNITLGDKIQVGGVGDFTPNITISIDEENVVLRKAYDTEIDTGTFQTSIGDPHLYPVILYNASNTNTTVAFTAYNFMNRTEDASDNIIIKQYSPSGQLQDITTHSLTFTQGITHHNVTSLYEPEDDGYFIVNFYTELTSFGFNSSLKSYIGQGINSSFCADYCDAEGNFYDGYINAYGVCAYDYYPNSSSCSVFVPSEPDNDTGYSITDNIGSGVADAFGLKNDAFSTAEEKGIAFLALILAGMMSLIPVFLSGLYGDHKNAGTIYVVSMLSWVLIFTFIGWLPAWIVTILLVLTGLVIASKALRG